MEVYALVSQTGEYSSRDWECIGVTSTFEHAARAAWYHARSRQFAYETEDYHITKMTLDKPSDSSVAHYYYSRVDHATGPADTCFEEFLGQWHVPRNKM